MNPASPTEPAHPRDISAEDLQFALTRSERPDLLTRLVELSRGAFGFYTSHFPHTLTYAWIAARVQSLHAGARALDIGAGLSPVPLFLAANGVRVETVDNSSHVRRLPTEPNWNEWGFFDYQTLHPQLRSHHCDVTTFAPPEKFDAIYSIAVLAHMPRSIREEALRRCHEWLLPEGRLLLEIDLIPATDFLWARALGQEVEPPIQHGTINHVREQLRELSFRIDECAVQRSVPKSRTDLLFIAATRFA